MPFPSDLVQAACSGRPWERGKSVDMSCSRIEVLDLDLSLGHTLAVHWLQVDSEARR